jgi:uncharacterized protein (TIGR01777 family)
MAGLGDDTMNVLVSGSTGFLGAAVVAALNEQGWQPVRLVRAGGPFPERQVRWDPRAGAIDTAGLAGIDAVVNLAGENIVTGRWTPSKKAAIRDSRIQGTSLLCKALAALPKPLKTLISASAVGYYGDRGDEILTEEDCAGGDFLSQVCVAWEAATAPAAEAGIRTAVVRIGIVLSAAGGALKPMLLPFRLGLGGALGSGRQHMSWITLADFAGAILHVLKTEALAGPINVVAPEPVTNAVFTKTLGRLLSRPAVLRVPAFAARLALGELADALLLSSARVNPAKLLASGYVFRYPTLDAALRRLLSK